MTTDEDRKILELRDKVQEAITISCDILSQQYSGYTANYLNNIMEALQKLHEIKYSIK